MGLDRYYIMCVLWPKRTGKPQRKLAEDIGFSPWTYTAIAHADSTGIYYRGTESKVVFTYKKARKLALNLERANPEYLFFSRYELRVVCDLGIFSDNQKEDLLRLLSKNVPETYEQLPREVLGRELHSIHSQVEKILAELKQIQAEGDSGLDAYLLTRMEQLLYRQGDLLKILFSP